MIVLIVSKLIIAALAATPAILLATLLSRRSALPATGLVLHHRVAFVSALLCLLPLPASLFAVTLPSVSPQATPGGLEGLAWFLGAIWLLGAIQVAAESYRVHRAWQTSLGPLSPADPQLVARIARLARSMQLKAPAVYKGGASCAPCLAGLVRPKLIIPAGVELPDSVLRHELAHLARYDLRWSAIYRLGAIVFWFHPLIFRLEAEARLGQEMVADGLATQPSERRDYVDALLLMANRQSPNYAGLALTGAAGDIERRVRAMYGPNTGHLRWGTALLVTLLLAVPLFAAIKFQAQQVRAPVAATGAPVAAMAAPVGR